MNSREEQTLLAERAAHFHDLVLDVAYGPGGMIVDFPRYDTRRPFQDGEPTPQGPNATYDDGASWGDLGRKPTGTEWGYGENTLWATGLFLLAQLERFAATGEEEARETARKCFRDLNHYFALSAEIEPGLLGKPHGGRPGGTWSADQSAIPVLPYARYAAELATPAERDQAVANLRAHSEMYLRRNWTINFLNKNTTIVGTRHPSALKPLAAGFASHQFTGDERVRDAVRTGLQPLVSQEPPLWPKALYQTNHNLWYWAYCAEFFHQAELVPDFEWTACIEAYWKAAKQVARDDGLALLGDYDTVNERVSLVAPGWTGSPDWINKGSGRYWQAPSGYVCQPAVSLDHAQLGLMARRYGIDTDAHHLARKTLIRVDEDLLRWWWDDGSLPAELRHYTNLFSTETATAWLAVYWTGKAEGAW